MSQFTDSLSDMAAAAAALPRDSVTLAALPEEELLAIPALFADITRQLEPSIAATAGEIARRSAYDLGYQGLAQKTGFRTPEKLVQHLTGSTNREATTLVRTGVIIHEAEVLTEAERSGEVSPELTRPWLAPVGRAVAAGILSIEAAEAIRLGLGAPTDDITADTLAGAAAQLVEAAAPSTDPSTENSLNADQLLDRARALRDELDEAGIADRETARYRARSFKRFRRPDGMTAYSLLADPENAATLDGIYDSLTSPRRGGPRMVDETATARDAAIESDPRSIEQLAFDGVLAILRIGADTDGKTAARTVLGARRPAVRVLVTGTALATRTGHGRIEGQSGPVSIDTVERIVCETGTIPVAFDDSGQCIDLGREQRLYSTRQRIGLAARDGGCRWPDCDRPPSWCEAHHINQWARDHGNTDLADGILLCRHHHMLLHNNHWRITRTSGSYQLVPPTSADPTRTPRPMPHKSGALDDLHQQQREREREHRATG
ncbi:MAG: DUF222 domain-containing protein [Homoserinimonas sp.]